MLHCKRFLYIYFEYCLLMDKNYRNLLRLLTYFFIHFAEFLRKNRFVLMSVFSVSHLNYYSREIHSFAESSLLVVSYKMHQSSFDTHIKHTVAKSWSRYDI